jgi:hypothetical protein
MGTKSLTKQEGGNHYLELGIQPWEIIEKNGLDFWEGSAITYILRWRKKGGANDLKKAIHFLEFLIEKNEK